MTASPKRKAKPPVPVLRPIMLIWRWHYESDGERRVWRSDWPGDTFEVMTRKEFEELERVFTRFSFPIVEAGEFDDEEDDQ